ncbi:hypothetical protein BTM25_48870 [Actinomadura rubteroloni]|uniref:Uncharacterized protein n=1 Tax=Actinomadura rubteroloni TaxID=1926885 RepID=A0A2P4UCB5_9ACTN|nr:SseB family protein [Actinomadura rubteroloni]POM22683.1 hypothetical protein BTM25_48870 [Actinomadura rubteroloni]
MDWEDFAGRLSRELQRLPVRSFIIVQGPTGLPYVQAMRSTSAIDAEAVGSAFLPRPLSHRQERRLGALGWRKPDGRDRLNWSHRLTMPPRMRLTPLQSAEVDRLADRMVAAFRDVYGVRSPLDLVYQAGRTSGDGGGLALPGLGLPLAIPEAEQTTAEAAGLAPPPAVDDLEAELTAARRRGDEQAYLALLAGATLCLPVPGEPGSEAADQFATAKFGDGTYVLGFTSPEAMDRSLRGQAVHHRPVTLAELARAWPRREWGLAVDPGLPSAAYLDAETVARTAGADLAARPAAAPVPESPSVRTTPLPSVEPPAKPEPDDKRVAGKPAPSDPSRTTPDAPPRPPAPPAPQAVPEPPSRPAPPQPEPSVRTPQATPMPGRPAAAPATPPQPPVRTPQATPTPGRPAATPAPDTPPRRPAPEPASHPAAPDIAPRQPDRQAEPPRRATPPQPEPAVRTPQTTPAPTPTPAAPDSPRTPAEPGRPDVPVRQPAAHEFGHRPEPARPGTPDVPARKPAAAQEPGRQVAPPEPPRRPAVPDVPVRQPAAAPSEAPRRPGTPEVPARQPAAQHAEPPHRPGARQPVAAQEFGYQPTPPEPPRQPAVPDVPARQPAAPEAGRQPLRDVPRWAAEPASHAQEKPVPVERHAAAAHALPQAPGGTRLGDRRVAPVPGSTTPDPPGGGRGTRTPSETRVDAPKPSMTQPDPVPADGRAPKPLPTVERAAPTRIRPTSAEFVVMQKVLRPEHVRHYVEGGYELVAGYVHRLKDVADLRTPTEIVRALGLTYQGTPFSASDDTIHVLRWPAVKPTLFRTPLGGIDEWSMEIIPGGWVIENAPFPGSGYAPGDGPPIPEFKIDSQRLPHEAEIYRIDRSGEATPIARFDADRRQWRRTAGGDAEGARR